MFFVFFLSLKLVKIVVWFKKIKFNVYIEFVICIIMNTFNGYNELQI